VTAPGPDRAWREALAGWAIPEPILAAAPESPWTLPRAHFASRTDAQLAAGEGVALARAAEALRPRGSLLDVGAGTGRYTLPLARVAGRVTAVEPSAAMRSYLEASATERGLDNVTVVPEPWESARVEPHDVALVSHVLYPIADVVPFIRKVDAVSRLACVLVIRIEQLGAGIESLWTEVWGSARPPEPTFLDLFNLLYAMGIRANAQVIPFGTPRQGATLGATLDDALHQIRSLLFLAEDDPRLETVVRPRIPDVLVHRGDHWAWKEARHAALIWWTKP